MPENPLTKFLAQESTPVVLGDIAQAIMGEDQNSPAAMLGRVSSNLGKSRIAAKAAQRQAAEREQLNKALMSMLSGQTPTITEDGVPGATDVTVKRLPDGKAAITVKGDVPGSTSSGAPAPVAKPQAQTAAPKQGFDRRLLPFFLASLAGSSGGAKGNLTGLSPEQITQITNADLAGGQLTRQNISGIYDNVKSQALADYYGRLPQKAVPKGPTVSKMTPGGDGYYHKVMTDGTIEKTNIRVPKTKTTGSGPKTITPSPKPWIDPRGNAWQVAFFMDENGTTHREVLGPWMQDDTTKTDLEMQEIEDRILLDIEEEREPLSSDINNFNSKSNGNTVYIKSGDEVVAQQLPPGVTAQSVYRAAKARKVALEDAVYTIQQDALKKTRVREALADPTLMRSTE